MEVSLNDLIKKANRELGGCRLSMIYMSHSMPINLHFRFENDKEEMSEFIVAPNLSTNTIGTEIEATAMLTMNMTEFIK